MIYFEKIFSLDKFFYRKHLKNWNGQGVGMI